MFQPILKQLATLVLAGALILLPIASAEALTEAQVIERLSGIPVFTLTDDKGAPLLGSTKQGAEKGKEDKQVLLFFLNPNEANTMLKQVQTSNPDLGKRARVIVRSMNDAYKIIQDNKDKSVDFQIVPSRSSLESARTILTVGGKAPEQLPNIPVFYAVDAKKGNEDSLLTVEQQGKQFVPFFFEKADLQSLIDNAKKGQSSFASDTKIQVVSLVQVLDSMVTRENNKPSPDVEKFTFIPSRTAYDWILKNQPKSSDAKPSTAAPKPAATPTPAAKPAPKPAEKPAATTTPAAKPAPKPTEKPAATTTPAAKPAPKPSSAPAKPAAPTTKLTAPESTEPVVTTPETTAPQQSSPDQSVKETLQK